MHTAHDINSEMFSIRLNSHEATPQELLGWESRDRLGVVVNAPLGGLGAGLLTMVSITAFYDEPTRKRRIRPLYPDIYLFHVGGPWGVHGGFDFWPDRKEIFVPDDATEVLRAINSHGITHLVVPDGIPQKIVHRYKEPEAAIDRIKQCYAYVPSGMVAEGDVVITACADGVLRNFEASIMPEVILDYMKVEVDRNKSLRVGTPAGDDARHAIDRLGIRLHEVDRNGEHYRCAAARIAAARNGAGLEEHLRRTNIHAALGMLGASLASEERCRPEPEMV
jgi:hypothetical protein